MQRGKIKLNAQQLALDKNTICTFWMTWQNFPCERYSYKQRQFNTRVFQNARNELLSALSNAVYKPGQPAQFTPTALFKSKIRF
jgi:hypothetical protein